MSYEIIPQLIHGYWGFMLCPVYSPTFDDDELYESFPDVWQTEAEAIQAAREYAHENDMDLIDEEDEDDEDTD